MSCSSALRVLHVLSSNDVRGLVRPVLLPVVPLTATPLCFVHNTACYDLKEALYRCFTMKLMKTKYMPISYFVVHYVFFCFVLLRFVLFTYLVRLYCFGCNLWVIHYDFRRSFLLHNKKDFFPPFAVYKNHTVCRLIFKGSVTHHRTEVSFVRKTKSHTLWPQKSNQGSGFVCPQWICNDKPVTVLPEL